MTLLPFRAHKSTWALGLFVACFLLSAATYWNILSDTDQVLGFNDGNIEANLSPIYHFPDIMVRMWDNQAFFGSGGGQAPLTVGGLGESFGAEFYRRSGQALILALCGLAFYWMCRQYQLSRFPSALAAVILSLSGWSNTFALSGLPVRPVSLAFAALSIGFIERGRLSGSWLAYAIAGGLLGLSIAEVPDVGAFLALAAALVFWWTHLFGGKKSEDRSQKTEGKGRWSWICSKWSLIPKFTLYVGFSALLGWQMITGIVGSQIQGVKQGTVESPDARFAWATQWSIPPVETFDLVAGNYFGSSMRSSESPYWGRIGQSEGWQETKQGIRNFNMTGRHLGVIPCILFIALFIFIFRKGAASNFPLTNNQESLPAYPWTHPRAFTWMIFAGSVLSIMLMWGKYFPLYRLFWSLPYISTIRNPEKWVGPLSLFFCLGIAFMLDLIGRQLKAPPPLNQQPLTNNRALLRASLLWSGLGMAGIALAILIGTASNKIAFINGLIQDGYKDTAGIAYDNAINACLKVLIISGLFSALVAWVFRKQKSDDRSQKPEDSGQGAVGSRKTKGPKDRNQIPTAHCSLPPAHCSPSPTAHYPLPTAFCLLALALLSIGDLYLDNRPYVVAHKYKHFLQANPLTDFLDTHKTEGRIKLMPPQHPLLNNLRSTLLQIKGYDLFDPVSVSRMPTDYAVFFKTFEDNPIRLWELGSLRYFLTLPGAVDELNKLDGNKGRFIERLALGVGVVDGSYVPTATAPPAQRYLRLVEFTGALPKYRLVYDVVTVPLTTAGDEQALTQLSNKQFDVTSHAVLHSASPASDHSIPGHSSITTIEETPTKVCLRIISDTPCWLIRSTKHEPDWKALLNGQPIDIRRVDYLFQGVKLNAGTSEIIFSFSPKLDALIFAITTHLFLITLIVFWIIRHQKRKLAS